jgi:hypothetical protein
MGRPYQEVNLKGKGDLHVPLNFILFLYLDDIEIKFFTWGMLTEMTRQVPVFFSSGTNHGGSIRLQVIHARNWISSEF